MTSLFNSFNNYNRDTHYLVLFGQTQINSECISQPIVVKYEKTRKIFSEDRRNVLKSVVIGI